MSATLERKTVPSRDLLWQYLGFFPSNRTILEQNSSSDPHSKRFQVVHLKPVCSLYPTGRCSHLPVVKCAFIRSISALTSLKSSGQSENTHFLQTRVRWGLAQMRKSHSFHLNSLKHVCQKAESFSQSSVRPGRRIPLVLQALRFHSGFPGSALLLGAIWVFTKMWFPPNILTHLGSCIRWTTIVPHPALDHLIQTQDAHWRISQITQRGELVRSAGGGEQMGINQTGARFTPSSFPVEPLKDVSPWENSPFLPF